MLKSCRPVGKLSCCVARYAPPTTLCATPCRRKGSVAALLERKNAGVAARDQKDRAEIKVRLSDALHCLQGIALLPQSGGQRDRAEIKVRLPMPAGWYRFGAVLHCTLCSQLDADTFQLLAAH